MAKETTTTLPSSGAGRPDTLSMSSGSQQRQRKRLHNNDNSNTSKSQSRKSISILLQAVVVLIGLCAILGIFTSIHHVNNVAIPFTSNTVKQEILQDFKRNPKEDHELQPDRVVAIPVDETGAAARPRAAKQKEPPQSQKDPLKKKPAAAAAAAAAAATVGDPKAHYPALNCRAFGGPSEEAAQEMVYWQDIPSDSHYVSPFHPNKDKSRPKQYMTFEPDGGGWNNIRMAMETVVGLAIATGRILVLPPEQRMYLLAQGRGQIKTVRVARVLFIRAQVVLAPATY